MLMPCLITKSNTCFGSLIYEEYGTDHLSLESYNGTMTESVKQDEEELTFLEYPQQPLD